MKVAYTSSAKSSFFHDPSTQHSDKMYLDRDKSYYYVGYLGDHGGTYRFKVGLFGGRTKYNEADYPDLVRNEKQNIAIKAEVSPSGQVA